MKKLKLSKSVFVVNAKKQDPTKTQTLRTQFSNEISGKFAKVRKDTKDYVDYLFANRFEFETDSQKLEQFNEWFQTQIDANILQVSDRVPWTDKYIEKAYKSGTKYANTALKKENIEVIGVESSLQLPVNKSSLELLYTRTYAGLEGITASMATNMSRILADGFAAGSNPKVIAAEMAKSIDKITKTRAKVLARTEIINTHATATLNNFKAAGVENVNVVPEWVTAADACPLCRAAAARTYTIKEAYGLIPLHPNCRCAWSPKVIRD